jgi:hypothetical protein
MVERNDAPTPSQVRLNRVGTDQNPIETWSRNVDRVIAALANDKREIRETQRQILEGQNKMLSLLEEIKKAMM